MKTTKKAKKRAAKTKTAKASAKTDAKKLSQIEAAVTVLAKSGEPMNCMEMVEAMAKQRLWSSPGGKTPHATLYSAILRDINSNGKDARFVKVERGQFGLAKRK